MQRCPAAEPNGQKRLNPAANRRRLSPQAGFSLPAAENDRVENFAKREVKVLATVSLKEGESQENLLKRFRKEVMKERILSDARRKRWYISPSEMRRIERQRAIRRARRRQRQREARQNYR